MRRAGTSLLAICVVLALAACGDDGTEPQTSAAESPDGQAVPAGPKTQGQASGNGHVDLAAPEGTTATTTDPGPEPGTKPVAPGVPVQAGGDNSVQTFGAEGEIDQREQALATLRAYLNARVAGHWAQACAATSEEFREQTAQLVDIARGAEKPEGCAATLRRFLGSLPRSALRESAQVNELLSFRAEGDYAYVIFRGAGDEVKFIAMANDDGEWKVNTTEPGTFNASD